MSLMDGWGREGKRGGEREMGREKEGKNGVSEGRGGENVGENEDVSEDTCG